MKKKRMGHLIDYQREIIQKLRKIIDQNDRTMNIQDNAIVRKDQEVEICMNASKALKETLEDTQEALRRSRKMVEILRANKESRSLREMGKDLYRFFYEGKSHKTWESLSEDEHFHWMTLIVEILSGEKLIIR